MLANEPRLGWAGLGWADLLANCLIGSSFRTLAEAVSNISNNPLLRLCFVPASHQAAETSHNGPKCSSEVELGVSLNLKLLLQTIQDTADTLPIFQPLTSSITMFTIHPIWLVPSGVCVQCYNNVIIMLRNNGNRGAVKLRGGWVIGGEWTQSLAEIPSWRREVVASRLPVQESSGKRKA